MYKVNPWGIKNGVIRESDGTNIPNDPDNRDWRAFLDWQAAGNRPVEDLLVFDRERVIQELKADAATKNWDELVPVQKKLVLGQPVTDQELGLVE